MQEVQNQNDSIVSPAEGLFQGSKVMTLDFLLCSHLLESEKKILLGLCYIHIHEDYIPIT